MIFLIHTDALSVILDRYRRISRKMIKFKYTDCSNDSNLFRNYIWIKENSIIYFASWERNITIDHEFFFFLSLPTIQIAINKIYIDLRNNFYIIN